MPDSFEDRTTDDGGSAILAPAVAATPQPDLTGDIYARVTAKIMAALEGGTIPWSKPWASYGSGLPSNIITKHTYSGINTLLCWLACWEYGFKSDHWVTARWLFQEGKKKGIALKRLPGHEEGPTGQKATVITYYGTGKRDVVDDRGEPDVDSYRFLKTYLAFNLDQLEGVPDDWLDMPVAVDAYRVEEESDDYVRATKARIIEGGGRACYSLTYDEIRLPPFASFRAANPAYRDAIAIYNGARFHELVHWTGAPDRLHRLQEIHDRTAYAKEELIAEMGAAFLAARFGYHTTLRHAGYIQSWLAALKHDKRLVITAASAASKAVQFLDELQPKESPCPPSE